MGRNSKMSQLEQCTDGRVVGQFVGLPHRKVSTTLHCEGGILQIGIVAQVSRFDSSQQTTLSQHSYCSDLYSSTPGGGESSPQELLEGVPTELLRKKSAKPTRMSIHRGDPGGGSSSSLRLRRSIVSTMEMVSSSSVSLCPLWRAISCNLLVCSLRRF